MKDLHLENMMDSSEEYDDINIPKILLDSFTLKWAEQDYKTATAWYKNQSPENELLLDIDNFTDGPSRSGLLDNWFMSFHSSFLDWAKSEGNFNKAAALYISTDGMKGVQHVLKYASKKTNQIDQQELIKSAYLKAFSYAPNGYQPMNIYDYFKFHLNNFPKETSQIKDAHLIKVWLEEQMKEAQKAKQEKGSSTLSPLSEFEN